MKSKKRLLIITGGPISKLDDFKEPIKKLGLEVTLASFYDLEYLVNKPGSDYVLKVQSQDISSYDLIYIRMIGKRFEDATLLVNYAIDKKIKLVDQLYNQAYLLPSSISKAMELAHLTKSSVRIPPTYFASLFMIRDKAAEVLGFPFVIKSTTGKKARDVWSPKSKTELEELVEELRSRERQGERFFAQKLVHASQRIRVFVLGTKALGAITRPTKWRKRWIEKVDGEYPEGEKESVSPVPKKYENLALAAAKAVRLDISGVDILVEDITEELFVIEANAAPSWKLIKKDTSLKVEEEILKYLQSL